MVVICQQCGDRGFANALVYCVECLGYAIHRYCLDVLPGSFDEFVPWVCDDCQPNVPSKSTFPKHNSIRSLEEDLTSSVPDQEIHSRSKLKKNRDTPLENFPLKVDLKKRKERETDYLVDGINKGGGHNAKKKKKKKKSTDSLLNSTEKHSYHEAIGEPDKEFVPLADAHPKVNSKKRRKERDSSSLVDGREENSCHQGSTKLDKECAPLSELGRIAKLKKMNKKRRTDSFVAGMEKDNCHAIDPDCLSSALANSPVKLKLKESKKTHPTVNVQESNSCHGAMTEPEEECALSDSATVKVKLKLKKDVSKRDARESKLKGQSIPSQQTNGECGKHDSDEHVELAGSCSSLKRKSKMMEYDDTCSVSRSEDNILQNSSRDPPQEACSNLVSKKKDVAYSGEVQKCRNDSSRRPVETDKMIGTMGHLKLGSAYPSQKLESDSKSNDNKLAVSKSEDQANQQPSTLDRKNDISEVKTLNIEKESRPMIKKGNKPGNEVSQSAKFANNSLENLHEPARPVIDPIWMGSFDIVNKDHETFEGFVGHVSSKAAEKVVKEASLLPSLLGLEMLPKSEMWPKSFQEYQPSDENIALYFFPADSKHERVFDHLVEDMINQELAMRASVTNAELLIFASKELPKMFWRFQGKYYLWGVFKGKRVDPSPPLDHELRVSKDDNACARPTKFSSNDVVNGHSNLTKTKA